MLFPTAYFGPIFQYALLVDQRKFEIDGKEHFVKQSYRSRCEIYGANGKLKLIVPLQKWNNHSPTETIRVSYDENWPLLHWRSIMSAYRSSPYFEFYEDDLKPFFDEKFDSLLSLNYAAETRIWNLLNIHCIGDFSESFEPLKANDPRKIIHPNNSTLLENIEFPEYTQVFSDKFGFIKNLSILDLLFNLGPNSYNYLKNIAAQYGKEN
tara:strand:+ start:70 stop:696 length:627 start_codon:yes stop_codon:yes gene_type:complete